MVTEYNNIKYLFIHIGGNAGTSIEWYLYTLNNKKRAKPSHYLNGEFMHIDIIRDKDFGQAIGDQHKTFTDYMNDGITFDFAFTVIRNPFDRILSKFFASPQSQNITEKNAVQLFESFVNEIYSYRTDFAKEQAMHTCCQSNYLCCGNKVPHILRFEYLEHDFKIMCEKMNLPDKKLIKSNSTSHPLKSNKLYNYRSMQRVYINNKHIIDTYYN